MTRSSWQRSLLLLSIACPEMSGDALARISIGQRDTRLLQLRSWTLGPHLDSVVDCPACSERLEFVLDSSDILAAGSETPREPQTVDAEGFRILVRPPNSLDLAAVDQEMDVATARTALLSRCIVDIQPVSEEGDGANPLPTPEALSNSTLEIVMQCLDELDPQADVRLDLTCPACGHEWESIFDIATYFWREIDDWAQRTLRDVHTLAMAYSWREADILGMSAWRRQAYLQMVTG